MIRVNGILKHTEEEIKKMRETHLGKKTQPCSCETKKKIGLANKGRKPAPMSEEHKQKLRLINKGKILSKETKLKMSLKTKGVKRPYHSGKNNPGYIDGRTKESFKIRCSIEYEFWRMSIFGRDNFTCAKYKIKGVNLVAHHIKNFAQYPELRLAIDNGITLSKKAHVEFHNKYGRINNTKEQLEEFLGYKIL